MNKRSALPTVLRPALAVCFFMLAGLVAPAKSTADLFGRLSNNTGLTYTITPSETQEQRVAVKRTFTAPLPDLAGTWGSNIGLTYTITQSRTQCIWTDNNGVTGAITLAASGLTTNWTDAGGPHSATGVIMESDATGRPKTISWNNGVVFQRASVAEAEHVALTPIQLPAPVTQPASRTAALADDLTQRRSMASLSPQLLAQVTASITRRAMIETLSAFPETLAALEQVAASAGMTASLLTVQMLSGAYAVDTVSPPNAPPAQALLDLWKAPVHFSPNVPGPVYQVDGSTRVVGKTTAECIYVRGDNSLQMMDHKDFFMVGPSGQITIDMELPPGGGQYGLAVQVVDEEHGKAITTEYTPSAGIPYDLPAAEAFVMTPTTTNYVNSSKVSLVKNSNNTSLVGLFSESPYNKGWPGWGSTSYIAHVSIRLKIMMKKWGVYAGMTVTRL